MPSWSSGPSQPNRSRSTCAWTKGTIIHLCLDKGYDNPTGEAAAAQFGYTAHIRRIGEEKLDATGQKKHPARRWVVEHTFAWLSRCRAVLVRYDKLADRYVAMVKLAVAMLWFRRWHALSQKAVQKP